VRCAYDDSAAGGGRLIEIRQGADPDDPSGQGAAPRRIAYGCDADGPRAPPGAPPVTTTITYTYDAADRLQRWSRDGAIQDTCGYDANGNRTHVNSAEVATYDDQERLVACAPIHPRPIPEAAVGYRIDPQHRHIARTEYGEVTHRWVYRDDLNPVAELNPDGSLRSLCVYADNANTPTFLVQIDPDTGNRTTYRYLTDHLGSPRLLVDIDTGHLAQRLDYDP
jgi:hypothetical protein